MNGIFEIYTTILHTRHLFPGLISYIEPLEKEGKYILTKSQIQQWLSKQETSPFIERQRIIVPYIDYQWEIDIAYMTPYEKENDGYGYFLLVIDVFSKYVWTFPLKSTGGREVTRVFQDA